MAQNTTSRRNIASLDPTPTYAHASMDLSDNPKHPIHPDSIQSISNNFSKLYLNHKTLSSLKQSDQEASIFHTKHVPFSSILDSSCTTLTKSKSQHAGRYTAPHKQGTQIKLVKVPDFDKKIEKPFMKPKEEDETTQKEWKTKESIQEKIKKKDVKKAQCLMSRSYNEGCGDVKRTSFMGINGSGGTRKSFCSSQTEMAHFFLSSGVKVVAVDMPPFMQIHAVDFARKAHDSLEKFTARTLACTLKREFDGVYGPAWHCIVGTSFGSFVTHSVGGFMYFSMDQKLYILLFKTTVQKAE